MTYYHLPSNLDDELQAQMHLLDMEHSNRLRDMATEQRLIDALRKEAPPPAQHDKIQYYIDHPDELDEWWEGYRNGEND